VIEKFASLTQGWKKGGAPRSARTGLEKKKHASRRKIVTVVEVKKSPERGGTVATCGLGKEKGRVSYLILAEDWKKGLAWLDDVTGRTGEALPQKESRDNSLTGGRRRGGIPVAGYIPGKKNLYVPAQMSIICDEKREPAIGLIGQKRTNTGKRIWLFEQVKAGGRVD